MYIPEKLKINRFKVVRIPTNKDYFGRFGTASLPESMYSGEEAMPMESRKIDQLSQQFEDFEKFDQIRNNDVNSL